jgi:dipeptidase E
VRLYLSSHGIGNQPGKLTSLFVGERRVAIILNARDDLSLTDRENGLAEQAGKLKNIGIDGTELDLRGFKSAESLKTRLSQYCGVWIPGGNAFLLRRAMYDSGFDKIIGELLENNDFVYAGYSAGVVILGHTMRGLELVDDATAVKRTYGSDIVWDGLNLIDCFIVPHFRSDHPESPAIEKMVAYFRKDNIPYETLRDGQAILINNSTKELLK